MTSRAILKPTSPAGRPAAESVEQLLDEVGRLRSEVAALRSARQSTTERRDENDEHGVTAVDGSRRQLFRVAAASAVGLVAGSVGRDGRPVAAADPNDVVKNVPNPVTDTTTLNGAFPGPALSVFNDGASSTSAAVYASSDTGSPTVRADNDATDGLGGVGVGGNAPGGRDLAAIGSGRIAMDDHSFGNAEAYAAGEIHQSGGTLYAMVTPTVRREITGPASAGSLHPVTPTRVYDSRLPGFDPLAPGESRVVSVADGRDVETGIVTEPDLVPPGATAIAYTITVDQTAGPGYVQVSPASATGLTASTINWNDAGDTRANSSLVGLSDDRRIRVLCAPSGATHFIIDVLGYYT